MVPCPSGAQAESEHSQQIVRRVFLVGQHVLLLFVYNFSLANASSRPSSPTISLEERRVTRVSLNPVKSPISLRTAMRFEW